MRAREDKRRTRHNKPLHREHKHSEVLIETGRDEYGRTCYVRKATEGCLAYWEEIARRHGLSERSMDSRDGTDHKLGFYGTSDQLDAMISRIMIEMADHRVKPGHWTMLKGWDPSQTEGGK